MTTCLICKKDIKASTVLLNSDLFREKNIHRQMHLVAAATESIIFLEDLAIGNKHRVISSEKEKDRLILIIDKLKRTLWIEPLFDDEED